MAIESKFVLPRRLRAHVRRVIPPNDLTVELTHEPLTIVRTCEILCAQIGFGAFGAVRLTVLVMILQAEKSRVRCVSSIVESFHRMQLKLQQAFNQFWNNGLLNVIQLWREEIAHSILRTLESASYV